MIQEEKPAVKFSTDDMILMRLGDLKEGQRDLNQRMDRLEMRMDRLEMRFEKLDERIEANRKELNERIDRLASKMDSSSNHGQIATITTIGIAIAVIYSLIK